MDIDLEVKMSSNEISAFKELKNMITEEFGLNAAKDERIIRFLKARDFNVAQAHTMLKENLNWRKAHRMDLILQEYNVPELFSKYFATRAIGYDKEGSQIHIFTFGTMDHKGFVKSAIRREVMRFTAHYFELSEQKMRERAKTAKGKFNDKWTIIMDFEDFAFSKISNREIIERCIESCIAHDANFPERLRIGIAINAPTSFQLLFSIVKPFMSLKTQQKIKIFGKDGWKEELLKLIDPSVLPAYLGGEKTDPDGNPRCHSIVCHGTTVPEKFYMKSMKQQYLKNQDGVKSLILQRRSKFNMPFDVREEGMQIEWEFETDNYDVGFGLFYKDFSTDEENEELIPLLPIQRFDSYLSCETGAFKCKKPGSYILMLDNSYSFLRSKTIYYKVSLIKTSEEKT